MLFHPEPLASSDKVCTQTEHIVYPRLSRSGAVVSIVLHVQSNESLGHTVNNRQSVGGSTSHPQILKVKEKGNVRKGSEQVSSGSKLVSASNNLEDFPLDLLLKGSTKLVAIRKRRVSSRSHTKIRKTFCEDKYLLARPVRDGSNTLHLLQVLGSVVGVNHCVLNGNIVSSKEQDRLATRVIKVLNVVDDSFNDDLGSTQALDGSDSLLFGSIGGSAAKILCLALSQLVCVGRHGYKMFYQQLREYNLENCDA
jgi:hypothetical protein